MVSVLVMKYKATYLNILLESIMPKNQPADTLQNKGNAKKKQTKPIRSSNKPVSSTTKRQKPDLIIYNKFPQMTEPTFVQKDKFTGVNMPIFI